MIINIIGLGKVGSAVAYGLILSDNVKKIVITDIDKELMEAELMDLTRTKIILNSKVDLENSDEPSFANIYAIAVGLRRDKVSDFDELHKKNYKIVEKIVSQIKSKNKQAKILIITNPVGRITEELSKSYTGIEPIGEETDKANSKIIGLSFVEGKHEDYPVKSIYKKIVKGKGYTNWSAASETIKRITELSK